MSATTLTGLNSFALRAELNRLVDAFVAESTDMGLDKLDGEEADYNRVREALQSLPFLASKKMVVLTAPGANKQFLENFEGLLANVPKTTDVIIVEPKLDKRTAYYKYLQKNTDFQEFNELDENGLGRWLVELVKLEGGEISSNDARYLVGRAGANQQLLSNELAKLLSYNKKITRETVDLLVEASPQSSIFDLLDAAFNNKKRAIELYDEQREIKVEPQQILAMIAWQLHILALVKTAGDRDANQIAKEAKINPYVVKKSQAVARRLTLAELKTLVQDALILDTRLKSESIDADEALRLYLIGI